MDYHTLPRRPQRKPRLPGKITQTNIKYIEVDGVSLHEIFRKSLSGMAEVLKANTCNSAKHYNCIMNVEIKADNREKLLLNFLSNILKLTAARKTIYSSMNIKELTDNKIIAQVFGVWYDRLDYEIKSIIDGECIIRENLNNNNWKSSILFEIKKV
tara:strand:+ start:1683 stop:2150 length:468 start_codon:yes stop_codon:yes gene_type:complete